MPTTHADNAGAVSLITGAGSGIGAAAAAELSARGDRIVCVDRDLAAARLVADSLPCAFAVQLDVRDAKATEAMTASVMDRYERIDTVVPCAGAIIRSTAQDMSPSDFRKIIDINLKGTFLTVTSAVRAMVATHRPGSVVLIGSIHSIRAMRGQAAYAASKGAILTMGRVFAAEWATYDIRVNTVGPGFTSTPLTEITRQDPVRMAGMMKRIPLSRPAQPVEIAKAIAYLSSTDAGYVTGAYLNVDGGWLAS